MTGSIRGFHWGLWVGVEKAREFPVLAKKSSRHFPWWFDVDCGLRLNEWSSGCRVCGL